MSRPTASELRWPIDDESRQEAEQWAAGVSGQVLDWTWRAFAALHAKMLSQVDLNQPLDQLERNLTSDHFRELQQLWAQETGGFTSISPHHEWPEMATRSPAPAKPPAYDIAFVWNDNPRIAWPIEAKVVPTPATLAPYLSDVEKFVNGTAAPFVGEGALIAYLLNGTPSDFFSNLSAKLSTPLQKVPAFLSREHCSSFHARISIPDITLHHLAMRC